MSKVIKTSAKKQKKAKGDENKRIPCPFCKELILPEAKKCRFCKENLNQGEKSVVVKPNLFTKKITPPGPYKIWVLSMVIFLVSLPQLGIDNNSYWVIAMLSSVAIGSIAFFALLASIPKSKGKYGVITLLTFFIFFGLLFNYETIVNAFGLKPKAKNTAIPSSDSINVTTSPSLTSTPSPIKKTTNINNTNSVQGNKIDCVGPDGKQFKTTMEECKSLNEKWGKSVDYVVDCIFPSECGGGTHTMKKSECDKPCQPINGNSNPAPQAPKNNTSGSQLNFYCYNNTTKYSYYTSSGEQCNLDNSKSACRASYDASYYFCTNNCKSSSSSVSDDCIWNQSEPETTTCLNNNNKQFEKCLEDCGNTYQNNVAKCN